MKKFFEHNMRLISAGIAIAALLIGGTVFFQQMFFGDINAKVSAPYVTGAPEPANVVVTKQSSEAVPLTSENTALPEIPPTQGVKGSETNPFVVLEIVPDHSEQAISYLVSTPEEGLPFDPMKLGTWVCENLSVQEGSIAKLVKSQGLGNAATNLNNLLGANFGAIFNNNNHYDIYTEKDGVMADVSDGGHDPVNYTTVKKYYTVSVPSGVISEDDFNQYSLEELANNYPDYFVTDDNGTEIRDIAIKDDVNWLRTKSQTASYQYTVKIPAGVITEEEYQNDTVSTLAKKYPEYFKKDTSWKQDDINPNALTAKYDSKWSKKKEVKTINTWDSDYNTLIKPGYLYYAGAGKGELWMENEDIRYDWNSSNFTVNSDKNKNEWTFYADEDSLPTGAKSLADKSRAELSDLLAGNKSALVGGYIKINDVNWVSGVAMTSYEYSIDVTENNYTFEYYNLYVNDILKHRLFERETEKEYEDFKIKVISVTPKEINEMDQNDTAETLNYIERADMFYVSMFYEQDDGIQGLIKFTREHVLNQSPQVKYYDYFDNDLEWDDCMKIIDRLCNNKNLPLIFENAVGLMLNKGVNEDGSVSNHIYLNEKNKDMSQVGSINNMAKLFLVTTQMDLTSQMNRTISKDERNFYRDIYPYFQKIAINNPTEGSAKYTGYYKRTDGIYGNLCECNQSADYRERGFYLWGKAMFLPNVVITDEQVLIDSYGYSENYINGGSGKASNFDIGNNKYGQSSGSVNMDAACGIFDNDEANVAIVYDDYGGSANPNKTIVDNSGFNKIGKIAEIILSNGSKHPEKLVVTLLPFKKQYVKLSDTEAMLDYNRDATYRKDKDLTLKLAIQNPNNEDCILESVQFGKTDESGNVVEWHILQGDGATAKSKWYAASKNDAQKAAYKAKDPKAKVLDANNVAIEEEEIVFNTDKEVDKNPYTGIKIGRTSTLKINLPYTRSEWLDGYDRIRITTRARISYKKKNKTKFVTAEEPEVHECLILGRGLFNLN